jgi:hypothetical protein
MHTTRINVFAAVKACKFFDKTFIDTSKLHVEMATAYGEHPGGPKKAGGLHAKSGDKPKASPNSDATAKKTPEGSNADSSEGPDAKATKPEKSNKELDEFLAVVQRRSKAHFWANDEGMYVCTEDVASRAIVCLNVLCWCLCHADVD